MQVSGLHETMIVGRVVFLVVAKVGATRFPLDKEMALSFMIFDTVEAHVDRLWSLLLDGIVGELFFRLTFDEESIGRLWVVKFADSVMDREGLLAINEGGADFGIGSWSRDIAHWEWCRFGAAREDSGTGH